MTKGLPMRKKIEIIFQHGKGLSFADIGKQVKASKSAVKHWVDNYNAGGDLSEKSKPGRPPRPRPMPNRPGPCYSSMAVEVWLRLPEH